jgi:N-acetylmuramic acid 6-phosphate etherase
MILNMISTAAMIRLGRVEDNKMVNMKLTNEKIMLRGTNMLMEKTGIRDNKIAKDLLLKYKSVKKAMEHYK